MSPALDVAILWHMHQPDYRDLLQGRAILPWVRLHAVKDYYPMAALVDEFPGVRVTFNFVPSLLAQLEDYLEDRCLDDFLLASRVPAEDLDQDGRLFLLRNFFMANPATMIEPHPRYAELLEKRGPRTEPRALEHAARGFNARDLRDLQVWFNLVWFGPYFLSQDPGLRELLRKGQNFSEDDKGAILARQKEVAAGVIPLVRRLAAEGRVEVSTTPFYHPILPLLIDTDVARVAMPGVTLPRQTFRHPEDAEAQVRKAIAYHERLFGERPRGMWPSEGSVSQAVVEMLAAHGFEWAATDENILFLSLGRGLGPEFLHGGSREQLLYRAWRAETSRGSLGMFFRDHVLSDLVGFSYSRWNQDDAASDMIHRLRGIAARGEAGGGGRVACVILDGENAWEYYPDGGLHFLRRLYAELSRGDDLHAVSLGEHLRRNPPREAIRQVFPGSWINNNFAIWIGHHEDNRAWDLLTSAREAVVRAEASQAVPREKVRDAWEELYMAEGSDWCWWYGDDHSSGNDEVFDDLYRRHLINMYRLIGERVPDDLLVPILGLERPARGVAAEEVSALIAPKIDGKVTSYFEWLGAVSWEVHRRGETMHRTDVPVSMVHCGVSLDRLFVRLDLHAGFVDPHLIGDTVVLRLLAPEPLRLQFPISGGGAPTVVPHEKTGKPPFPSSGEMAIDEIVEIAIPWSDISATSGQRIQFIVTLEKSGNVLCAMPVSGHFEVPVPGSDFERLMWSV